MTAESQQNAAQDEGTIKEGDLVQLELHGWINESGKLFTTTDKELAQKEGIYSDRELYQPVFEIIGRHRLFPGLENSILNSKVGEEREVEIKPEEAAGPRDPSQVKLYSVRELERQDLEPRVGADVIIGNRIGRITQATAGRVRIDFNNPLAGHVLRYRYKVLRKIQDPSEKIRAFIDMYYGSSASFSLGVDGKKVSITVPETAKIDQRWMNSKLRIVADAFEYAGMEEVQFVETYIRPQPAKKEENQEAGKEDRPEAEVKPEAQSGTPG